MVPNLRMREDMEEMFDMNWLEYVRRDTEGSDNDTRRRAACELVRGLTDKFPAEVPVSCNLCLLAKVHHDSSGICIVAVQNR